MTSVFGVANQRKRCNKLFGLNQNVYWKYIKCLAKKHLFSLRLYDTLVVMKSNLRPIIACCCYNMPNIRFNLMELWALHTTKGSFSKLSCGEDFMVVPWFNSSRYREPKLIQNMRICTHIVNSSLELIFNLIAFTVVAYASGADFHGSTIKTGTCQPWYAHARKCI